MFIRGVKNRSCISITIHSWSTQLFYFICYDLSSI